LIVVFAEINQQKLVDRAIRDILERSSFRRKAAPRIEFFAGYLMHALEESGKKEVIKEKGLLTYANQLTILRMIFIPCFVLLLIYGHVRSAILVFIAAGITDGLDGLIARMLQQKTVLGSFLDPMADKLLLTAAFITLTVPSVPVIYHIPVWLTITSISRDLLIALASLIIHLQTGHTEFPPSFLGKCTTAGQLITTALVLLANLLSFILPVLDALVFATLLVTVASGMHYFYRSVMLIESYQRAETGSAKKQS
jgi:cardiolipin synthase